MMYEKELNSKTLADGVELVCVDQGKLCTPRKGLVLRKYGEEKRIGLSIKRNLNIALKDGVTIDNLEESIENGDAITFTPAEMIEIYKEIGYFIPVSEESIRNIVDWFINGRGMDYEYGMEWGNKIKEILSEDEKEIFREWENLVGYEDIQYELFDWETFRKYNCEDPRLESAIYVVMHSQRLLNSAIYLKAYGIDEHNLSIIWNYLLCYDHKSSFIDVMFFSDWDKNNPDELMEKYYIKDEIIERENRGLFQSSSASTRYGEKYKMAMQIQSSIDDWGGVAVVVPIDCELSPLEIVNAGKSIKWVEDNIYVKNQLVM